MNEPEFITRRKFFAGLCASVVAAGVPLPEGIDSKNIRQIWFGNEKLKADVWYHIKAARPNNNIKLHIWE